MESFFGLLQNNVLDRRTGWDTGWDTRDERRLVITAWIERTYHRRRCQRRLNRMAPVEYEAVYAHHSQLALTA